MRRGIASVLAIVLVVSGGLAPGVVWCHQQQVVMTAAECGDWAEAVVVVSPTCCAGHADGAADRTPEPAGDDCCSPLDEAPALPPGLVDAPMPVVVLQGTVPLVPAAPQVARRDAAPVLATGPPPHLAHQRVIQLLL